MKVIIDISDEMYAKIKTDYAPDGICKAIKNGVILPDTSKNEAKIVDLLKEYADKHTLALECGGEYVWQDDEAQEDAIELVGAIFDNLMTEGEEEE